MFFGTGNIILSVLALVVTLGQVYCQNNEAGTLKKIDDCRKKCADDPIPLCRKADARWDCIRKFYAYCRDCQKFERELKKSLKNPVIANINNDCTPICRTKFRRVCYRGKCTTKSKKKCKPGCAGGKPKRKCWTKCRKVNKKVCQNGKCTRKQQLICKENCKV